jgi:hypothetical protein
MGMVLFAVVMGLVLAAGFLEKEDKLWSLQTLGMLAFFSIVIGIGAFASDSSTPADSERIRTGLQMGLGMTIGLIYCILYTDKIRNKKFPMAAGGSVLAMAIGFTFIFFDLVKWLDKVGN